MNKTKKVIAAFSMVLLLATVLNCIFALPAQAIGVNDKTQCIPEDAYQYNGHSYKVYECLLTWEDAKEFCEELNGHLATVTSDKEWSTVLKIIKGYSNAQFWLGASDERIEDEWRWITGEPWKFSAWMKGQPDNSGGNQDYLQVTFSPIQWIDREGTDEKYFVCEWDYTLNINEKTNYIYIPENVYTYGNHYYKYYPYPMKWQDAKEYCENFGGHLATVTTEDEWNFVHSKAVVNTGHFWLGATDENLEGEWKWVTGERWSFTAWSSDYPNIEGDADYLYISSTRSYLWHNWTDSWWMSRGGFICEWDYCCISDKGCFTSHDWGDWNIIKEAVCSSEGERFRICNTCGERDTEILQVTHQYGEFIIVRGSKLIPPIVKEKTCMLCGEVERITDWGYVWIPILVIVVLAVLIIGVINYIRAFK